MPTRLHAELERKVRPMSEAEDIEKVVNALRTVPEKRLLILELANKIPVKNGYWDIDALRELQPEINLAIAEAKAFGSATIKAVDALVRIRPREEV